MGGEVICARCGRRGYEYSMAPLPEGRVHVSCMVPFGFPELVESPEGIVLFKGFTRHYHNVKSDHTPYRGFFYSVDKDERIGMRDIMHALTSNLPEGTIVEFSVKVLGIDKRATEDPVVWYEPQHYDVLSRVPEEKRREIEKIMANGK